MSEEQLFGAEAVERDAGFTSMPDAPSSEPADDSIKGDSESIRGAADELSRGRERSRREDPPDTIEYKKSDKHGRPTDETSDPKLSVSRERAASDLARYRQQRQKAEEAEAEAAIREHVDGLRQGTPQNAQQQVQPQGYSPEQQHAQAQLNAAYQQSPSHGQYSETDKQIHAAATNPQFHADVKNTQAAIAQRMQELDHQISQAWTQGQDAGGLTQEYQQLLQQHEQIGYVERVNLAIQSGMSPKVATAVADREVLHWMQQAVTPYEEAYRETVKKHASNCEELLVDGI